MDAIWLLLPWVNLMPLKPLQRREITTRNEMGVFVLRGKPFYARLYEKTLCEWPENVGGFFVSSLLPRLFLRGDI